MAIWQLQHTVVLLLPTQLKLHSNVALATFVFFVILAVVVVVVASHAYCRLKRKTCELQKASDNTNSH